jgi:hypothetical protein
LHVSGHSVGGEDRYATIWEQRDGSPWIARHRLTGAEYKQVGDELSRRPIDVSAYTVAGEDRFATIWEQRDGPPWLERHGLRSPEYQQLVEELSGQGFRPLHVRAHPRVSAVSSRPTQRVPGGGRCRGSASSKFASGRHAERQDDPVGLGQGEGQSAVARGCG